MVGPVLLSCCQHQVASSVVELVMVSMIDLLVCPQGPPGNQVLVQLAVHESPATASRQFQPPVAITVVLCLKDHQWWVLTQIQGDWGVVRDAPSVFIWLWDPPSHLDTILPSPQGGPIISHLAILGSGLGLS